MSWYDKANLFEDIVIRVCRCPDHTGGCGYRVSRWVWAWQIPLCSMCADVCFAEG